jgi:methanogenic corrinoid protein MtbC1
MGRHDDTTDLGARQGRPDAANACELSALGDLFGPAPPRSSARPSPQLVSDNGTAEGLLSRVVELEIVPRLLMLHGQGLDTFAREREPALSIRDENVRTLACLVVEGDATSGNQYVQALIDSGASREAVLLDLLCPCARLLGELWDNDVYTFSEVTIGMWRLQRVLDDHRRSPPGESRPLRILPRRMLMITMPGAQHTFGALMAASLFRAQGWDMMCDPGASLGELIGLVTSSRFDVIGVSISGDTEIAPAASAILTLRRASANPRVVTMVGGPMASQHADLDRLCGADLMATDAKEAIAATLRLTRNDVLTG